MPTKRVLNVGQCMADNGSITRLLRTAFAADVVPLDSIDEALTRLRGEAFDLVLVNRVFDTTGEAGLELIRSMRADPNLATVPVMLVSNFPEAQSEAVAAGATAGFGKAALSRPETAERLREFLG